MLSFSFSSDFKLVLAPHTLLLGCCKPSTPYAYISSTFSIPTTKPFLAGNKFSQLNNIALNNQMNIN
jgi:hypothetical protein